MSKIKNGNAASALELLTISFVVLKLTKQIDWSWVWILSPVWISAIVFVTIFIGYGSYVLIKEYREGLQMKKQRVKK